MYKQVIVLRIRTSSRVVWTW